MKKVFKFFLYFLGFILLAVAGTFFYFFIGNRLFLESKDPVFVDYLKNNRSPIIDKINDDLFDEQFYASNVFLLGEIHGYADNQKLDQYFIQFLNQKAGVKHYIAEMDSTNAKKLNIYLNGTIKEDSILYEVVAAVAERIPQQSSKELFDKWSNLYDYNKSLDDSLKISVIGVDTDFSDNSSTISRDSAMFLNFKTAIQRLGIENEKFYGLFGLYHTLQNGLKNQGKTFAERLKNNNFKVTSIVSHTLDSEMYLPENPQFPTPPDEKINWVNADGPFILVKGINDLRAVTEPNSMTLFYLSADQSPYKNSQKLINIKSRIFGESFVPTENSNTTDYFQYVVLLRNSNALSKLK